MLSNPLSSFRFIVYSAQILLPAQQTVESLSGKRRKTEHPQLTLTSQQHTKGLAHWIGSLQSSTMSPTKLTQVHPSDGVMTSPRSTSTSFFIQTIILNTWRKLSSLLFDMKAKYSTKSEHECLCPKAAFRHLINSSCYSTYWRFQDEGRGEIFEEFIRNTDSLVENIPKRSQQMDLVWEIERSSPARRTEINTLTEYRKRLIAKIESLQSTGFPFKDTIEAFVDILGASLGSLYRTDHSMFIEVYCGLTNAQCSCWECWDAAPDDEETMEKINDSPK